MRHMKQGTLLMYCSHITDTDLLSYYYCLNNIKEIDCSILNKSEAVVYPAIWQPIFQEWSKFTNLECNDWLCFVYKKIWWTTLSSLNSRVFFSLFIIYGYNFAIVKVLIFTFSYYFFFFFCIPGTNKIHGARWLLFFCLKCKCSFP